MPIKLEDHPRGCGENRNVLSVSYSKAGSPPRMRGKPRAYPGAGCVYGITPADAGKTLLNAIQYALGEDHPRGCGENIPRIAVENPVGGSPPRMRGKLAEKYIPALLRRITPADAGKTSGWREVWQKEWDHPRGCGENVSEQAFPTYSKGSPPRMRGKLNHGSNRKYPKRITPADAGKTLSMNQTRSFPPDHPRGCGENRKNRKNLQEKLGSPPRMRGKHKEGLIFVSRDRITPADAGKTRRHKINCIRS